MDNVTHALLGATVAQAAFGRTLGARAAAWGAAASVIPDLDVIAMAGPDPLAEFRYHRGTTHALWFQVASGAILGWLVWRWHALRKRRRSRKERAGVPGPGPRPDPGDLSMTASWMALFVVVLLTHPVLDAFTTYGTQLLAPFSRRRFAWDAIAIVDPAYTAIFAVTLVAMAALRFRPAAARRAGLLAAAVSSAYLAYGLVLNARAEAEARRQLAERGIAAAEVNAYPTLLQLFLRRVVARAPDEVRVGLVSLWRPGPIAWRSFTPESHPLLDALRASPEGRLFEWFALGQTTGTVRPATAGQVVALEDLRYSFSLEPREGLWGIRAVYAPDGRRLGPVERFTRRPEDLGRTLVRLWRATWDGPHARADTPSGPGPG